MSDPAIQVGFFWIFFFPIISLASFVAYIIVSKKQGKKVSIWYYLMMIAAFAVWFWIFTYYRQG